MFTCLLELLHLDGYINAMSTAGGKTYYGPPSWMSGVVPRPIVMCVVSG